MIALIDRVCDCGRIAVYEMKLRDRNTHEIKSGDVCAYCEERLQKHKDTKIMEVEKIRNS